MPQIASEICHPSCGSASISDSLGPQSNLGRTYTLGERNRPTHTPYWCNNEQEGLENAITVRLAPGALGVKRTIHDLNDLRPLAVDPVYGTMMPYAYEEDLISGSNGFVRAVPEGLRCCGGDRVCMFSCSPSSYFRGFQINRNQGRR